MKNLSTRGQVDPIDFQDAVLMGLADDGGLIVPESIPDVGDRLDAWRALGYADLAFEVLRLYATDLPEEDLRDLDDRTYGEAASFDLADRTDAPGTHARIALPYQTRPAHD